MALVTRSTGNTIQASDVDQYLNALTGVMTDQAFLLAYSPGSSTSTPVLELKSNGNGPALQVFNGATQKLQIDQNGNISGVAGSGIPTTRNGTATCAGLYTGSTTPTGDGTTTPATGAVWVKA